MLDNKQYYTKLNDYRKVLTKNLRARENKLTEMIRSKKYDHLYLEKEKADCRAYRSALIPSLKEEAARLRKFYVNDLKDAYSPARMKVSDNIKNALESHIRFTADEWTMLMEAARTDADRRAVRDVAYENGFNVTGYVGMDERLARYDRYVDTMLHTDGEMSEIAPSSYENLQLEEAFALFMKCDDYPVIVATPIADSFESMGYELAMLEQAEREAEEELDDQSIKSFYAGADMTPTGREDVKRDVAEAKAMQAVESVRQERKKESVLSPEQQAVADHLTAVYQKLHNEAE